MAVSWSDQGDLKAPFSGFGGLIKEIYQKEETMRLISYLLVPILCLPAITFSQDVNSLSPTKQELDRSMERAEQARGERMLKEQQERSRVRSQAERDIDRIPKKTTVKPILKDGGVGIKVVIPNK